MFIYLCTGRCVCEILVYVSVSIGCEGLLSLCLDFGDQVRGFPKATGNLFLFTNPQ